MVFGRGKENEIVKGLDPDETLQLWWESHIVTEASGSGLTLRIQHKKYNYAISNKRAIITNKKAEVLESCPIDGITLLATHRKAGTGNLEFWKDSSRLLTFYQMSDPDGIIQQLQMLGIKSQNPSTLNDTSAQWHQSPQHNSNTQQSSEDPLNVLKIRFAKGEITKEEFEEMKSMLG
jgi:hypothetical protein